MLPLLRDGCYVIYKKLKKSSFSLLKNNQIVIAIHPFKSDCLIIKKILYMNKKGVFLIGLNINNSNDSRNYGIINYDQVLGIVEKII